MAGGALRHPDWYLISEQKFRQRAAVVTSRQTFRGEDFVVLSDRLSGQHMRLSRRAQDVWQMLDGSRSAQQIFDALSLRPGAAPTQAELVEWIVQLVGAGLILSDHDLNPKHLTDRQLRRRNQTIEARAASPLSIKVRLFDPSGLIRVTYPLVAPLFSPMGAGAIVVLFAVALVTAALHFPALMQSADGALLSQSGLVALALAYPVMKALHELAHGYAVHHHGGEVREFGVMFLIFFPVPYVEASEASAFPSKYARMLVGAGGILAELILASVALLLWVQIEPGLERAILFNFVLIGSVSTVLFNGNPLLKFDAYFILADWLEMPNLATRSSDYLTDRFLSRVLGLRSTVMPPAGEAPILMTYGVLALAYRLSLTLLITVIVSQIFFVVGVLLAIWAVVMGLVWPMVKLSRKGAQMAKAQNRRSRAVARLVLLVVAIFGLGAMVKLPFSASGEGRIMGEPSAELRLGSSGEIVSVLVPDGAVVPAGTPLLELTNPQQTARADALELGVAAVEDVLSRSGLALTERRAAERELTLSRASLDEVLAQERGRRLLSPYAGRVAWAGGRPPKPGTFVYRGDMVGGIIVADRIEVVLSFPVSFAGLLPVEGEGEVDLLLPDGTALRQRLDRIRLVDAGQQVPPVLLVSGGGTVPEMPDAPGMALAPAVLAHVSPDVDLSPHIGARVQARISLPPTSAFGQIGFHLRRLFLRVTRL